jgi:hypothetical protein
MGSIASFSFQGPGRAPASPQRIQSISARTGPRSRHPRGFAVNTHAVRNRIAKPTDKRRIFLSGLAPGRDLAKTCANLPVPDRHKDSPVSNPDSFIDEVNEELKRDRLFAAFRKYGWIAILAVLLVVGWAAWNEWSKARETARAQAFGDAVIAALQPDDATQRRTAMDSLASDPATDAAQRGILNLLLAAEALDAGNRADALAALNAVATDMSLPVSYRQLATLKRVIAATEAEIPLAERQALIAPLAAAGGAFRPLALEQQALLRLEGGDTAGALQELTSLLSEADLSMPLRIRVQQLIVILGGELDPLQG